MLIWGCITYYGKGDLCRIHGTLDSPFFLTILNDYVLTSFDWFGMDPAESIFQQDNSRVHTANIIQQWLAQQEFTVLEWPANSPDLNIIEQVWGYTRVQNCPNVLICDMNILFSRGFVTEMLSNLVL